MIQKRKKKSIMERMLSFLLAVFCAVGVCACDGQDRSSSDMQATDSSVSSGYSSDSDAVESSGNSSDEASSSGEGEILDEEERIRQNLYKELSENLQKPFCVAGDLNGEMVGSDKTDSFALTDMIASARLEDGEMYIRGDGNIAANVAGISFAKTGEFVLRIDGEENAKHEAWFYDEAFQKFRVDENVDFYVLKNFSKQLTEFVKGLTNVRNRLGEREIDLMSVFQLLADNAIAWTVEKQEGGYVLHLVDGEYGEKINEWLALLSENSQTTLDTFLRNKGLDLLSVYNALTGLLSGKITVSDGLTMVTNYLQKEGIALSAEQVFSIILGHGALEGYKNQILDDVVAERFDGQSYQELVASTRDKLNTFLGKTISALMEGSSLPEQLLSARFTKLTMGLSAQFDSACRLQDVILNLEAAADYGGKAYKLTAALALQEFGTEFSLPQSGDYFLEPNFSFAQKTGDFMTDETLVYTFEKGSASYMVPPKSVVLSYSGDFQNGETKANVFNRTFTLSSEQIERILTAGENTLTFLVGEMKKSIAEDVRAYMIEKDSANAEFYSAQTGEFFLQNFTYNGPRGITLDVAFGYGEQVLTKQVTLDLRT